MKTDTISCSNIYTCTDAPGVSLVETKDGLIVRNGKRGKPVVLTGDPETIAFAFFAGLTYHKN